MCTSTDRALAIEELEHLTNLVKKWRYRLRKWYWNDPTFYNAEVASILDEMGQIQ
jgi:predicted DNA-binding transcriptional regulator AlpA